MPFKHNAARRHRIPKARYRVRNWQEYEAGLKRRGDLTLWLDEAAMAAWRAPRPRASAVVSTTDADAQSPRDRHVQFIAEKGRVAWQRATGYGRRSLAETTVARDKAIIGPKLHARTLPDQQGEAAIAAEGLNRMIRVAKPISIRVV